MKRLAIAAAGTSLLATCLFAREAVAQTTRECSFDDFSRELECVVHLAPTPPLRVSLDPGSPGLRLPLEWRRIAFEVDGETFARGGGCQRMEGTTRVVGVLYLTLLVNTETNQQLSFEHECFYPGDALPAPPEPPPSQPEFLEAAALVLVVDPEVNPNPAWGGITGVETWLWCTDPGDLDVGVSLRGWTATATMSPVQYHWDVSGPTSASFHPTGCGSEGSPAATWMPETMGPHTIEVAATWGGTWTLSYAGIPMGTFVLGPFDIDGDPVGYPVGEHVGILTDGSDE